MKDKITMEEAEPPKEKRIIIEKEIEDLKTIGLDMTLKNTTRLIWLVP